MPFDSDSKENSRDLGPWESWRSCYFWPFDRNNGRLMAKEHQSVNSNFTCSLLPWWHVMWEWELVVIQWSLTKFSLCPVSWKASFSVSGTWDVCAERSKVSLTVSGISLQPGQSRRARPPPIPKVCRRGWTDRQTEGWPRGWGARWNRGLMAGGCAWMSPTAE